MAYDLLSGKLTKANFAMGLENPLVWTPSAVAAELERLRNMYDTTNVMMSKAVLDKKVTSDEWRSWFASYKTAHKFFDKGSSYWGSNTIVAQRFENEALYWRDLLKGRGATVIGPAEPISKRPPGEKKPFIDTSTAIIIVGSALAAGYLLKHAGGVISQFKAKPAPAPAALPAAPSSAPATAFAQPPVARSPIARS